MGWEWEADGWDESAGKKTEGNGTVVRRGGGRYVEMKTLEGATPSTFRGNEPK